MLARACFLLAASCALLAASLQPAISDTRPYELFNQAREHWLLQNYPSYLRYAVRVTVTERGITRTQAYQSAYNAVTGSIWVDPISDYERTHPAYVHGIGFCFQSCGAAPQPAPRTDFFGVPLLAPTYSFGVAPFVAALPPHTPTPDEIVAEVRKQFNDPNPRSPTPVAPAPTPSGLKQIVSVYSLNTDYGITIVGYETIDNHFCVHLKLIPMHDPGKNRLRELWIDTRTYATVRLQEASNFIDGPGTSVPWQIDFTDASGPQYIRDETALRPVSYGRVYYSSVTISFEDIAPVPSPTSTPMFSAFMILREP
jgi:hypothetical protein